MHRLVLYNVNFQRNVAPIPDDQSINLKKVTRQYLALGDNAFPVLCQQIKFVVNRKKIIIQEGHHLQLFGSRYTCNSNSIWGDLPSKIIHQILRILNQYRYISKLYIQG